LKEETLIVMLKKPKCTCLGSTIP